MGAAGDAGSSWRLPRPAGARAPRLPVARLRGRLQPQRNCGACAGAAWYGQGLGSTRTACPERVHAMSGDTHPNPSGSTDDGSPDDLQMQAGEYVLGTLNAAQRRSIESRSEEHTSELQSQSNLVCRLLLEKKKKR